MSNHGDKFAVIDLGTNTFHVLGIQLDRETKLWEILHRERIYVKLASGGIHFIEEEARNRAVTAMLRFRSALDEHEIINVRAIGTAALRRASNAQELISDIQNKTNINLEVISGDEEARLIAQGISLAVPETHRPYLIMDIGGGSVEFILCSQDGTQQFAQSFPIGVAILFEKFHLTDPISMANIEEMNRFLKDQLTTVIEMTGGIQSLSLVGASGTFEVMEDILETQAISPFATKFDPASYTPIYESIVTSDLSERLARSDIPDSRADLIVVASHLINFILSNIAIESVIISQLAMKEGVLKEMLKNNI